ncbi:MAG TPA: chromate resistance protein ChrB domain-containing protein [Polyangiaceae bacterium]|nr:chromate resistance protein ChrB domain-containing protein [Polyangiaceae bacterium]
MSPVPVMLEANRWLLLIHQLPKEPAYLRVKIGRRLSRIGALALKNSVYVLPKTESASEDFQWVRVEILEGGGDATVLEARFVEGLTDEAVEGQFREAKDVEYAELLREARALPIEPVGKRKRALSEDERAALLADITRLEQRVEELATTDFFGASGRVAVTGVLRELRTRVEPPVAPSPPDAPPSFRARVWVTRTGIHVDRIASAWLIRRFIDPDAVFKFVPARGYEPAPGELRFDMFDAEFSHEGDLCTFEVLCQRLSLEQPGLRAISEIVHDIDLKDGKFARPETQGVATQITGLALRHRDDEARLQHGSELFEQLLAYFSRKKPEAPAARVPETSRKKRP